MQTFNLRSGTETIAKPAASLQPYLHVCNGMDPFRDGGMVPSILGFLGALAEQGTAIRAVTPTASKLENLKIPPGVELIGPDRHLGAWIKQAPVAHFHGLWQYHVRAGTREARRYRVPYVMAAHGMADPWALQHKPWKKRIYTFLVEGKNLGHAACLHALSVPEVSHLRQLAPKTPIARVPNGVNLAPFENLPGREVLEAAHPELRGKFLVLFLSRLHVKKGLDLLAESMIALHRNHPELHILLAGRDEGAGSLFLDTIRQAGLGHTVTSLGHVHGESARQAWGAADAFVLPSYSEGFSMAVLEALAARLPVLISKACHFQQLEAAGGGLIVEPNAQALQTGLRELLSMTSSERAEMATQGRRLVERDFTWSRQGARLQQLYHWVLGGGTPPEFVTLS